MRIKVYITGGLILSILSIFAPAAVVYAGNISVTQTCSVQVYIKATVPDSVQQGKTLTFSNFTVQPANTYGFNVTSSTYYLTATNTSSTTYTQDFYATNPSPTTGHSTYIGYYPNWTLDATGPAGGAVTIKLVKSVTVIQGYGGSPVTCTFNATLATIPITAPAPQPSQSPSPTPSPKTTTSTTPKQTATTSSPRSPTPSASPSASPSTTPTPQPTDSPTQPSEDVSVIPLNINITDSKGKVLDGAQVTLDDSKKLMTDINGRVTFSNVLTGNHAVLVSYNGQNVTNNIHLTTDDVGKVRTIKLPATSQPFNPAVIGAAAVGMIGAGAGLALFVIRRRKANEGAAQNQPAITIPTIIDGSAVPTMANATISHIPAIPAFDPKPAATSPAPWEPVHAPMPALGATEQQQPAPSTPTMTQPTQPIVPSAPAPPALPTAPTV